MNTKVPCYETVEMFHFEVKCFVRNVQNPPSSSHEGAPEALVVSTTAPTCASLCRVVPLVACDAPVKVCRECARRGMACHVPE